MLTLNFNGHVNTEFGIIVNDLGRRKKAQERLDTYDIPYRDGKLHILSGTYESYERKMTLSAKDKTRRAEINAWLTGSGKLITSDDPGGYFNATVTSPLDFSRVSKRFDQIEITFDVDPFFYLDSGDTAQEYTSNPQTIVNPGTVPAAPYIKITGSGSVVLTIGETAVSLSIEDYLEIDSARQLCYRDTLNKGSSMTGKFPLIPVGSTGILWTGTVSKVEIIPRWREQ